jgi:hypothetical protein
MSTTNFGTGTTIRNVFEANINPVDPAKQALVFASRKLNENNQIIPPIGAETMPSLYIPFRLEAYKSPGEALSKLRAMGFQFTQGLSFDETYPKPDIVNTDPTSGLVTLIWNSASIGLQGLLGLNPVGSVTQVNSLLVSTGTIRSINVIGNQTFLSLTPVTGSPTFTTNAEITIDALLASQAPDPATSDMVTLAAYWFYNQYATAAKFTTSANLWISVTVDGRDTSISPTDTPITLVAPNAVNAPGDGSLNLTYDITAHQLGLLPTAYLGQTSVTQEINLPTDSTAIIYFANGKYIKGGGSNNGLSYSTDGTNWTATNITSGSYKSIHWNGSVYVAAGSSNNGLHYSVNGITWTASSVTTGSYTKVYYANTKWVAASSAGLHYSSDGITWTLCTGGTTENFADLVYGNGSAGGVWVAVTADDDAWKSTDGITFSALSVSATGFESANFGNGIFQLGCIGTGIIYSTDGTNFENSSLLSLSVFSIVYYSDLSLWFAATSAGIYSSPNGITWTVTSQSTGSFNGFAKNGDTIIAYSTAGIKYSTDNGATWTASTGAGASGTVLTAIYNNGLFLAGKSTGLLQSDDGVEWITGSTTVEGTYNGYFLTSTTCVINVVSVTGGTFNTTNDVVIVLDSSQNGGVLTFDEQISCYATLSNIKDVETLTTTYSDFYSLITDLQDPLEASHNKFNPQGYYGYSPVQLNENPVAALTTPDVTYFKASARLDMPTLYQYPNLPVTHVMATLFQNMNNETPYNDTSGTGSVLNIAASTNKSTLPSTDTLNQLAFQGWTAIGGLPTGQMYAYRDLCTLQTLQGVEDTEFRSQPVQLKTRWLDENLYRVAEATSRDPDGMRKNNNPELIATMKSNLNRVLSAGNTAGMLGATQNSVSVTVNPSQPGRLLIAVTTTIVPTNSGNDITVYALPYSTSFSV